jgi:hypothetical protein
MTASAYYLFAAAARGYGFDLDRQRQVADVTRFQRLMKFSLKRGNITEDELLAVLGPRSPNLS